MKTVTVNASVRYDVLIEKGLLSHCGEKTAEVFSPQKSAAAIITDDNVSALYLNTVVRSFEQAGFRVCHFTFLHGEDSKSHAVLMNVYDFLIQNHITRSDFIVALGGGVVGDLAGFAAATYLRGIPFIQIPTTFLAAIDSSVGGKTAVNIPAGKNLIGAFHQPSLVLCDPNTFDTLSEQTFAEGCAEMIKYAMIWNRDFFDLLESCDIHQQIEQIVAYCVDIKRQVVEQDEQDNAIRMILNYGHTLGHAIEKVSNHAVTHGYGVALGWCSSPAFPSGSVSAIAPYSSSYAGCSSGITCRPTTRESLPSLPKAACTIKKCPATPSVWWSSQKLAAQRFCPCRQNS